MEQIIITKSLFKEFCENPKLARWHKNDYVVYNKINQDLYGAMNGALIGQEVENMVKKLREQKDISIVSGYNPKGNFHKEYHDATQKTLSFGPKIIYQAGFVWDNLFVKCDFLKLNKNWKYDLIEVKAKNSVRKTNKNESLLDELITDCSFQKYVLQKALWDRFSGEVWIYHLNKEYLRQWDIVPNEIIAKTNVTEELLTDDWIGQQIDLISKTIGLPKSEFEKRFPYQWENPLIYFWEFPPKWTIWNIPYFKTAKKKLLSLYEMWKTNIMDLWAEELELMASKDELENGFQRYVKMFQGWVQLDKEKISSTLNELQFPLFFYDYETISWPIPIFQGTHPRQQVVVQYSIHKMESNGQITHYEWLISPFSQTNKEVIDKFAKDIWNPQWTFIVRNKWFENSRNQEMWEMYLEYKDFFEQINSQTFDLMDIFRDLDYFDPAFDGSCSIKKVLPVLSDLSYDNMTVSNGSEASDYLYQLIQNKLPIQVSTKDLLDYCKQDTRAMVEIYNFLKRKIS